MCKVTDTVKKIKMYRTGGMKEILELSYIEKDTMEKHGGSSRYREILAENEEGIFNTIKKNGSILTAIVIFIQLYLEKGNIEALLLIVTLVNVSLYLYRRESVWSCNNYVDGCHSPAIKCAVYPVV